MFYLSDFIFGVILLSVRLFRKGIRPYVLLLKHTLRNPQIYISVTEPRKPSQNSGVSLLKHALRNPQIYISIYISKKM